MIIFSSSLQNPETADENAASPNFHDISIPMLLAQRSFMLKHQTRVPKQPFWFRNENKNVGGKIVFDHLGFHDSIP